MKLNSLLRLPALLVIGVVIATATGTAAHAQTVDESLPPLADLSIAAVPNAGSAASSWVVAVRGNRVGNHPMAVVSNVKVRFSAETVSPGVQLPSINPRVTIEDEQHGRFDSSSTWTIPELPRDGSAAEAKVFSPLISSSAIQSGEIAVVRVSAEITGSRPPSYHGYKSVEFWFMNTKEGGSIKRRHTSGDAGAAIDISDRYPSEGGATTFTVRANNRSRALPGVTDPDDKVDTQLGVRVKVELSPGLTFDGTPAAPSGTTFSATNTTTGIWNVGTLNSSDFKSLPVAVSLTSDSLSDLPLEKRCLTAKVVSAVPWFAFDLSKRQNDIAIMCLGARKMPIQRGDGTLFHYYDCVGVTAYPCTSTDTMELVANINGRIRQPDELTVYVSDPEGRYGGSWMTGTAPRHASNAPQIHGFGVSFNFFSSGWSAYRWGIGDVSPKQRPGAVKILHRLRADRTLLDADTMTSLGPINLVSSVTSHPYPVFVTFGTLGTYKINLTVGATKSGTAYTDSETYTFHVGPILDLEVRDAGANPAVATGRQAYTVMAVNNGPGEAPAVQVTGLPTGVTEYVASDGEYVPGSGVWTIGRLPNSDAYHSSGNADKGPTLTLITDDAAGTEITAEIENTQEYCVRIKTGATDPSNDLECTGSLPTGYTEHSVAYDDNIARNDSATITARAGTGRERPAIPSRWRRRQRRWASS